MNMCFAVVTSPVTTAGTYKWSKKPSRGSSTHLTSFSAIGMSNLDHLRRQTVNLARLLHGRRRRALRRHGRRRAEERERQHRQRPERQVVLADHHRRDEV